MKQDARDQAVVDDFKLYVNALSNSWAPEIIEKSRDLTNAEMRAAIHCISRLFTQSSPGSLLRMDMAHLLAKYFIKTPEVLVMASKYDADIFIKIGAYSVNVLYHQTIEQCNGNDAMKYKLFTAHLAVAVALQIEDDSEGTYARDMHLASLVQQYVDNADQIATLFLRRHPVSDNDWIEFKSELAVFVTQTKALNDGWL